MHTSLQYETADFWSESGVNDLVVMLKVYCKPLKHLIPLIVNTSVYNFWSQIYFKRSNLRDFLQLSFLERFPAYMEFSYNKTTKTSYLFYRGVREC